MVAKIEYGASLYGVIAYNHNKVSDGTASVIHTHNMINDISSDPEPITFPDILRSFEDYLHTGSRVKCPMAHFSLNPSPGDNLSDDDLRRVSDDYMEKMGYKDQPYIVYKHQDIDREHIHIVSVRIQENGKKITDSRDYERSMSTCRELEKKYGLRQINDRSKEESLYYLKKIDYGRVGLKQQISNVIKSVMKDYDFQTFGEFNALLSCFNISGREVKGEEAGNPYHGIVYNAMDQQGELVGPPIKSSRIGQFAGYNALALKLAKTAKLVKSKGFQAPYAKSKITSAMKGSSTMEQFTRLLQTKDMDVVFRQNEQGRIYGVTFIDHANKISFNGSRLGKEFSANIFNNHFANKTSIPEKTGNPTLFDELEHQHANDTHFSTSVDEIFGTFYPDTNSNDPQEEAFIRKLKRKKRKNIRRNK